MFRTGGVVSDDPSKVTVTVKLAVPTFPAASVAVQVTVVIPIGNVPALKAGFVCVCMRITHAFPFGGLAIHVGWCVPTASALTVIASKLAIVCPVEFVVLNVWFDGRVTTGGVVSGTGA